MVYYNFNQDLAMGESAQVEACKRIKKEFPGIKITDAKAIVKEFDIDTVYNDKRIMFEVKWDIMSEKTGNIAIEYESRGKSSGINVTTAHYWIFKISNEFYLIETKKIKKEIMNGSFDRVVTGGDPGSNTKMYLYKVAIIKSWGKKI